jgi:phage/plasmid-like protein (TIGR03299 family)
MSSEVETAVMAEAHAWWDRDKEHVFGRAMTKEEAWEHGGINWDVELIPIEYPTGIETGFNLIARSTDDKVFATCTDSYTPLQNWDLLEALSLLVDKGDLEIESAMSLKGGRVVAVCARNPEEVAIAGDAHVRYLTGANWHDRTREACLYFSQIRTECWNTLKFGMEGARNVFRFRHTGDMDAKMAEAREQLEVGYKYFDKVKELGEELAVRRLSLKEFDQEFLPAIAPSPRKARTREMMQQAQAKVIKTREGIKAVCMDTPDLQNHRLGKDLTGWGVLQGVVAFTDHHQTNFRGPDKADKKFEHAMLEQSEYTDRAVAYLTAS